jgi:hypothetical protein
MKTKILFVGLFAAFVLSVAIRAAEKPASQEFISRKGGFSVKLPGKPIEQTKTIPTIFGPTDLTVLEAVAPKQEACYAVGYIDYPAQVLQLVQEDDVQDLLKVTGAGAVQAVDGKVVSEKEIRLGAHPGREFDADILDGKATLRLRVYLVKQRLYMVMAVAPKGEPAGFGDFFGSFKLTGAE